MNELTPKKKTNPPRLDKDSRRNIRNVAFGTGSYVVGVLSLLITIPLLLSMLGKEGMGVVTLVKTVLGFGAVLSFGMGDATLKFISKYRALESPRKIQAVFRTTFTVYLLVGLASGAAILTWAEPLAANVFDVSATNLAGAVFAFRMAGVGLLAHLLAEVVKAAIKGYERIDVSASLDAAYRVLMLVGQVVVLLNGGGIEEVVLVIVAIVFTGLLARSVALFVFVAPGLSPRLGFDREVFRELLGFGTFSWLGSFFGKLRISGAPFVVGALLGAEAVTIFSIAVRVLTQVGNLVARGGQYMFPYISRIHETGDQSRLTRHYDHATRMILVVSCAVTTPIFVCGGPLLSWWLDPETAGEVMVLVRIMAIRFALLPLGLVNFSFLMATNRPQVLMAVNAASCVLVLGAMAAGAWWWGLEGAAWGQLAILVTFLFNRFYIERALFGRLSIVKQLGLLLAAGIPLALGTRFTLGVDATWLTTGCAFMIWAAIGGAVPLVAFDGMKKMPPIRPGTATV